VERETNIKPQHNIDASGHQETVSATTSLQMEEVQNQGEALPTPMVQSSP